MTINIKLYILNCVVREASIYSHDILEMMSKHVHTFIYELLHLVLLDVWILIII